MERLTSRECASMKIIYSCVVDRDPKFYRQALNLVMSLRGVGIEAGHILVNLTPPAEIYRAEFERLGCLVRGTVLFADGKYCNKVAQLRNAPEDADFVICCDTDIMFLRDLAPDLEGKQGLVLGKIVDFDNPPIDRFRAVAALDPTLPEIAEVASDVNGAPTLAGNFNGGLYILPGAHLRTFSAAWEAEALRLYNTPEAQDILGEFGWHIDQISFCFTLNRLGLEYETLPITFNFPLHFAVGQARLKDPSQLRILHYHDAVDENFMPVADKVPGRDAKKFIADAVENLRFLFYMDDARAQAEQRACSRFTFLAGFHRSGTSLLASGCNSLGYSVGSGALLAAGDDNPKGYYENRSLVRINERIQRQVLSDWDDIFFSLGERADTVFHDVSPRISKFLEEEFLIDPAPNYLLKDPRILQTYRIWKESIQAMGHALPEIIFIFRNPLECANSQQRRYQNSYAGEGDPFHYFGADLRETLLLWYVYTMRFLMTLGGERMIAVSYADLLNDPATVLRRLGDWSGIEAEATEIERFVNEFFEKGLRHHQKSAEDLRKATLQIPYVFDLYKRLEPLGRKPQVTPRDIRSIVEHHSGPYAELMQLDFLGRLYTVPKQRWIHERYIRRGTR
jgi:hypothetical protein